MLQEGDSSPTTKTRPNHPAFQTCPPEGPFLEGPFECLCLSSSCYQSGSGHRAASSTRPAFLWTHMQSVCAHICRQKSTGLFLLMMAFHSWLLLLHCFPEYRPCLSHSCRRSLAHRRTPEKRGPRYISQGEMLWEPFRSSLGLAFTSWDASRPGLTAALGQPKLKGMIW